VIAYTGQDEGGGRHGSGKPQYRIAYAEDPNLPDTPDDYLERARKRLPVWMKGSKQFKILRAEPYTNSQRVASEAIKGRVMLAGDALKCNNPIGGLGLTSGIADAFCFGNALVRVVKGKEPETLLTECANSRRQTWIDVTNQLSRANLHRLRGHDPETVAARDGFFQKLNTDSSFPQVVRAGMNKILAETFEA
jgi:2-polyprenyl-6-methoxyphenol hydroxylase-like FAD-dependent oxidoreductase